MTIVPITAEDWVEALESELYDQTNGQLRKNDAFCCLGVAGQRANCMFGDANEDGMSFMYVDYKDIEEGVCGMTGSVSERAWSHMGEAGTLIGLYHDKFTHMNDALKWSFKEIAEWIKGVMNGTIDPEYDLQNTDIHRRHVKAETDKLEAARLKHHGSTEPFAPAPPSLSVINKYKENHDFVLKG